MATTEEKKTTRKPSSKKKKPSFEQMMADLEAHLKKMESGELSLDEMIKEYAEGAKLAAACRSYLDAAEQELTETLVAAADKTEQGA